MKTNGTLPYLMAGVKGLQLAISAGYVQEIIRVPQWRTVPKLPSFVRGVINLREKVIPLIDLRLHMNMPSALKEVNEMIEMFSAREQDHIHWLKELEEAIHEKRPFLLARDPAKCAFGKWYYSYKTDDIGFASVLNKFEVPHRRIHSIADIALNYAEHGEFIKAEEIIEQTRTGDLGIVTKLFEEVREAFAQSQKELAVVLSDGEKHLALTVDSVASVEAIDEKNIEDMTSVMGNINSEFIRKVARKTNDKGIVFLFDVENLFSNAKVLP